MVNQILLDYFKNNCLKYSLDDLKVKTLASGYLKEDVEEALRILGESNNKPKSEPKNKSKNESVISGDLAHKIVSVDHKENVKWMKIAGILGFVFLGVIVISGIMSLFTLSFSEMPVFLNIFFILIFFFLFGLTLVYLYGFFRLGKYTDSKLIKISSFLSMITLSLVILLLIVLVAIGGGSSGFTGNIIGDGLNAGSLDLGYDMIVSMVIFSVIFIFIFSFWCMAFIGFIKIRDKVRFAKVVGILGLVISGITIISFFLVVYVFLNQMFLFALVTSSWFMLALIGYGMVYFILSSCLLVFTSLALFNASKKYEE